MRLPSGVIGCTLLLAASIGWADDGNVRRPLGLFVHVEQNVAAATYPGQSPTKAQLHDYLQNVLYAGLLANPAITGIAFTAHWDKTQLSSGTAAADFDWAYLDDVFAAASTAQKSVQILMTPGVDSPAWLMNQLPLCDPLFTKGSAPADCGSVTFTGFPEQFRADSNVMPLPWNPVYQKAWTAFQTSLNDRYGSNPLLVAVSLSGPILASNEMILPTTINTTAAQPSGLKPDDMWAALIKHSFPSSNAAYQKSDEVFIDAWKQAIDAAESIFTGLTIFLGPDAGNDFPNFGQTSVTPHPDNTLFAVNCSAVSKTELVSCEAKTEILSYFVTLAGSNVKGTQVGGMTAASPRTTGSIGVSGVKSLTSLTPGLALPFLEPGLAVPIVGGAEFDYAISVASTLQQEGCPTPKSGCPGLTIEEGAYNVLTVFFDQTPAAAFYGGTVGTQPMQYLDIDMVDLQYAQANPCPATTSPSLGNTSLQDLLARANRDLLAMAGQSSDLPPSTCTSAPPAPSISFVGNLEGEAPLIAPNTWIEIKGTNLGPPGAGRIWQQSDFSPDGLTMPTQLDGVSVTVNGNAAYVYSINPTQVNVLTPPDGLPASVAVQVSFGGQTSAAFAVQAQAVSPSFFVLNGSPYVAATHLNGAYIGPAGTATPAQPGETILIYANGFGTTNAPVETGSTIQSGDLSPVPSVTIGGVPATVQSARLVAPGEFQFQLIVPNPLGDGDQPIAATYKGMSTQAGTLLTIQNE